MELLTRKFSIGVVNAILVLVLSNVSSSFAGMNVNVKGVIEPTSCSVDLTGGAESLDWGSMAHADLKDGKFTTLPAKQITISIGCPGKSHIAFWADDPNQSTVMVGENIAGRVGHANSDRAFGIGKDPINNNPVGNFTLNPVSSTVDGTTNSANFGYTVSSPHTGTAFSRVLMKDWSYRKVEDWTPWDDAKNAPAEGQNFSFVFDVEPQLNKKENLTNSQRIPWEGTAQFTVRYF